MNNINQIIKETKKYLTKYDYENVIKNCNKILETQPESNFGLRFKGISYLQTGKYMEASKQFEKIIEKNPDDENANYTLAYLYEKLGKYEEALKHIEKTGKNEETISKRKRLLTKMKKYSQIIKEYNQQLKALDNPHLTPEKLRMKLVLLEEKAVFQYRKKDYTQANRTFKKALKIYDNIKDNITRDKIKHDNWYRMLSEYLTEYPENTDFNEFFKITEENIEVWTDKINLRLSHFEDSLVYCDLLLELPQDNIELLKAGATASRYLDSDYSLDCYNRILEIEPENTESIKAVLDIYSTQYSKDKALKLINTKLYIKDIKLDLLVRKITILESMTLYDEAIETYDEYLSIEKPSGYINNPKTIFDKIRCMEQKALELYLEGNITESYTILKAVSEIFQNTEKDTWKISSQEWHIEDWYNKVLKESLIKSNNNPDIFFKEFYSTNNENIIYWIEKIIFLIVPNHLGNPITYCNILLRKNSENIKILQAKAFVYYKTRRLSYALDEYNKILELDEDNNKAKNYKFNILVQNNQYKKSYDLLQSMEIDYKTIQHYLKELADKLLHKRKYEESLTCYKIIYEYYYSFEIIDKIKYIWEKTNDTESQRESPYYMDWIELINYKFEKYVCPKCGNKLIPIVYGYIDINDEIQSKIGKEFVLGGCCVSIDSPTDYCTQCKEEITMGKYGINITRNDSEIYAYTITNIRWITKYLENNPTKTIKEVRKDALKEGLNDEEFTRFIEKLEAINHIKTVDNHLQLVEDYDNFRTEI